MILTHRRPYIDTHNYGREKRTLELPFSDEMLCIFSIANSDLNKIPSPEYRRKVCDVFGFVVMMALKYLPPKQRKIFYSVWIRSGGKIREGVLEYSRRVGENYISNYGNFYKAMKNVKTIIGRVGYAPYISEYLTDGND